MEQKMNLVSLLISTLIPMIMGFIYYHPRVMGNAWMKANGFTKESIGKGPNPALYVLTLATSFLLSIFFWGWVTGAGGADGGFQTTATDGHSYVTFGHGVFHGFAFMLTVLVPIFATMAIFEMRSKAWALINIIYWGLTAMLMCGVLSAWR